VKVNLNQKTKYLKEITVKLMKGDLKRRKRQEIEEIMGRVLLIAINIVTCIMLLSIIQYIDNNYNQTPNIPYNPNAVQLNQVYRQAQRYEENCFQFVTFYIMIVIMLCWSLYSTYNKMKIGLEFPPRTRANYKIGITSFTGLFKAVNRALNLSLLDLNTQIENITNYIFFSSIIVLLIKVLKIIASHDRKRIDDRYKAQILVQRLIKESYIQKEQTNFPNAFNLLYRAEELHKSYQLQYLKNYENDFDFGRLKSQYQKASLMKPASDEVINKISVELKKMLKYFPRVSILEITDKYNLKLDDVEKFVIDFINKGIIQAHYDRKSHGIYSLNIQKELDGLIHQFEQWEKTGEGKKNKIEYI
jgi:PCI domain